MKLSVKKKYFQSLSVVLIWGLIVTFSFITMPKQHSGGSGLISGLDKSITLNTRL